MKQLTVVLALLTLLGVVMAQPGKSPPKEDEEPPTTREAALPAVRAHLPMADGTVHVTAAIVASKSNIHVEITPILTNEKITAVKIRTGDSTEFLIAVEDGQLALLAGENQLMTGSKLLLRDKQKKTLLECVFDKSSKADPKE